VQSTQAALAMEEQAKAMKEINTGSNEVAKQIKLITRANIEHSNNGNVILRKIREVSEVSASTTMEARSITAVVGSLGDMAEASSEPRANRLPRGRKLSGAKSPTSI